MKKIFTLFLAALFISPAFLFADTTQKELKITTYYPAPKGEYKEVKTDKVIFDNITLPDATQNKGMMAFSGDKLQYSDGNRWVAQSGGGTCYVDYGMLGRSRPYFCDDACDRAADPVKCTAATCNPAPLSVGASCTAPGFTVKAYIGTYGECYYPDAGEGARFYRPPGGSCWNGRLWIPKAAGDAYLCCE